jgi:methionine biosynthesis protein MetW
VRVTVAFVHALFGRSDYAIIGELVEPRTKVLDLGCGEAELLAWLKENKQVDARGVEMSAAKVRRGIARGVSVYQGDIDEALADYPDSTFDTIILSQTLQETSRPLRVLTEMLRVGRTAIVAFPNFGHWRVRVAHLMSGRAPKTELFPYDWHSSPNLHYLTVQDFESLVSEQKWQVDRRIFLSGLRQVKLMPNLTAEVAVYMFRKS